MKYLILLALVIAANTYSVDLFLPAEDVKSSSNNPKTDILRCVSSFYPLREHGESYINLIRAGSDW